MEAFASSVQIWMPLTIECYWKQDVEPFEILKQAQTILFTVWDQVAIIYAGSKTLYE